MENCNFSGGGLGTRRGEGKGSCVHVYFYFFFSKEGPWPITYCCFVLTYPVPLWFFLAFPLLILKLQFFFWKWGSMKRHSKTLGDDNGKLKKKMEITSHNKIQETAGPLNLKCIHSVLHIFIQNFSKMSFSCWGDNGPWIWSDLEQFPHNFTDHKSGRVVCERHDPTLIPLKCIFTIYNFGRSGFLFFSKPTTAFSASCTNFLFKSGNFHWKLCEFAKNGWNW